MVQTIRQQESNPLASPGQRPAVHVFMFSPESACTRKFLDIPQAARGRLRHCPTTILSLNSHPVDVQLGYSSVQLIPPSSTSAMAALIARIRIDIVAA
jgi:hypothetical protein